MKPLSSLPTLLLGLSLAVAQPAAAAAPVIRANGSDGPLQLREGDTLVVSVALDPGDSTGLAADWWVAGSPPWGGWFEFVLPGHWRWAGGQLSDIAPVYQGALFRLDEFEILNSRDLPAGDYRFHFSVDTTADGIRNGPLQQDEVQVTILPDSPFGFHPAGISTPGQNASFAEARDIGVRWNRVGFYALWFLVQPDLGRTVYDFDQYDRQWGTVPQGIDILANIAPQGTRDEGRCLPGSWIPVDPAQYGAFVRATVERYDGDGMDDMPGLANPIRYWQVGNEPNESRTAGFAELQRITYEAVKQACADCQVLIGGATGFPDGYLAAFDSNYAPILAGLDGQYVDLFDFHWYGEAGGDYRLRDPATGEDVVEHIRNTLTANGFAADLPIWITEMGAYSGDPADFGPIAFPYQSERQQAGDHFRRFIYSLSRGVGKVFPAFGLMEGFKHDDGYFDHTGLIYNGQESGDLGLGVRKLGYYSYKKMTEKLEGADWSTLRILHDGTGSDHLYLFRVDRNGQPVHVAWWDWFDETGAGDGKSLTVSGLADGSVTVTRVVPDADTGREVADYGSAFSVRSYPVTGGQASILLGMDPVILE